MLNLDLVGFGVTVKMNGSCGVRAKPSAGGVRYSSVGVEDSLGLFTTDKSSFKGLLAIRFVVV